VVVVSRGRPDRLMTCLASLVRQSHDAFEIVVVADRAARRRIDLSPALFDRIKVVAFDAPGISAARNAGIAQAAGEVVAFIDDDAAAEPLWLEHLAEVFEDDRVSAATGYVRGRNGLSFQHRLSDIGPDADPRPIPLVGNEPRIVATSEGRAVKTEGTNMAFRRSALHGVRGFDPAFRFYLDETDLDIRLAATGALTAAVPLAQVLHGVAASERRRADRVPLSLYDVGASLALFLRRHSARESLSPMGRRERAERRAGLLAHMVAGRIEPRDVGRILRSFDEGWAEGLAADLAPIPPLEDARTEFLPYRPGRRRRGHRIVAGRPWQARRRHAEAARLAEQGHDVTLLLLSPGLRPHRASFDARGYWVQTGGMFGRADREEQAVRLCGFSSRVAQEAARVAQVRGSPAGQMDRTVDFMP
jgi:GT2 family glycosyltransferase